MLEYVAGFLFSENRKKVLLIEKLKPEWQKGKYNGIGGKLEVEELPEQAMGREFKEEAGVSISDWIPFCEYSGWDWKVYFFKAFGDYNVSSQEEEQVHWVNVDDVQTLPIIDNLKFLIPMALHKDDPYAVITEY